MARLWRESLSTRNLKVLHLRGWNHMTGDDFNKILSSLPLLEQLDIVGSREVTSLIAPRVESPTLKRLSLCQLKCIKYMEIGRLPQLEELCIDSVQVVWDV